MRSGKEGGEGFGEAGIFFVVYQGIPIDIEQVLCESLECFLESFKEDYIRNFPIFRVNRPLPHKIPQINQQSVFISDLRSFHGAATLGLTDKGLFDVHQARNLFAYGAGNACILSTQRFYTETHGRLRRYEQLAKEMVKAISMAFALPSCDNPTCVVSYHRTTSDLDRNVVVCSSCRGKFVEIFEDVQKAGGHHCR